MHDWLADIRLVAVTARAHMVEPALLATQDWPAIAAAFGAAIARVAGDAVLVQVREKDLDGGPLLALVRAALATGARVMVNDRLDVALAAGAHGVHLPERGLAIADVRALAPALVVGVSCHSASAAAASTADLVQLGPIWDTPGKPSPLGPAALTEARRAMPGGRLVAIGGIDPARAAIARDHGADAVAAIRAVWSGAMR